MQSIFIRCSFCTLIIDEVHGILEIEDIIEACSAVFKSYDIEYCYLFGSYAKGKANKKAMLTF